MKLDIPEILKVLEKKRPVFHFEADFQLTLARYLRKTYPHLQIYLEHPINLSGKKHNCDIVLLQDGKIVLAIELKYFGENIHCEINDEIFNLKNRSAHNDNSYKSFKDVEQMEIFLKNNPSATAAVIVLTNNHLYWDGPSNETVDYAHFSLENDRSVSGRLDWVNKPKKDKPAIHLHGNYTLKWEEYSKDEKFGQFQYLHISVQQPKN